MKKWLFGMALLLVLTLVIRQLANYQQQSHLTQMKVAPAVLEHMDQAVVPAAPAQTADDWQGKTGLPATVESQFIDFLHLKFAEAKDDPAALQPEDLVYLGVFDQDEGSVRYWLLPPGYGALYGTVTMVDGSTPVFGVASSPPIDPASVLSPQDDEGQPMEPDLASDEEENPLDNLP